MRLYASQLILLAGLGAFTACTSRGTSLTVPPSTSPSATGRALRVVMFPYIPPFDSPEARQHVALKQWLESRFNTPNRTVEIEFRDPTGKDLGDSGVDVVEMELTDLSHYRENAAPWPLGRDEVVPGAWTASLIDGEPYAWPTYVCTNVLYSADPSIRLVNSLNSLGTFLRSTGSVRPLAADFWGGSTTPALFVDAALDNGLTASPSVGDLTVLSSLRQLFGFCGALDKSTNFCLNDSMDPYKGRLDGFTALRDGTSLALFGYSEFAYYLLQGPSGMAPQSLHVVSAAIGSGSHPLLFVDGLVLNRRCAADDACRVVALDFARFVTSAETQRALAFGEDSDASAPRYLLMAREAFWRQARVASDPIYSQLRGAVSVGQPMFKEAPTREEIWKALSSTSP